MSEDHSVSFPPVLSLLYLYYNINHIMTPSLKSTSGSMKGAIQIKCIMITIMNIFYLYIYLWFLLHFCKKSGLYPSVPQNYRSISRMPFLSTILEKIVSNQLLSALESNNIFEMFQFGFRKNIAMKQHC